MTTNSDDRPAIELVGLTKRFGGSTVVDDIECGTDNIEVRRATHYKDRSSAV